MGLLAVLLALSTVVAGVLSGVLGRAAFEEGTAARRALTVDGTVGAEIVTRRAADPAVQEALRISGVYELGEPTLGEGETPADLLADRCAFEDFDAEAAAARDYHFVALHERAVQHLIG